MNLKGKNILVSIILPFKNEEKYIVECVNSIIAQSSKNWELILVDDHSSDRSTMYAKEFTTSDLRIRYFLNPGTGVIDALKEGFKQSTGSLITRMDGDDIKTPDNIEQLIELTSKGVIGVGKVEYFREGGVGEGYKKYATWMNQLTRTNQNFTEIYKECVIPSPCWMCTREDFIACGGFDSTLYPEDYDLCFRFYGAGLKTNGSKSVIHYWRDHEIRTTRTSAHYSDNRFLDLKTFYFLKLDFNQSRNLILWGAGKKAKVMAKIFINQGVDFMWLTDNHKKIGHNIYGVILSDSRKYIPKREDQIVIAVSDKSGSNDIHAITSSNNVKPLWFC